MSCELNCEYCDWLEPSDHGVSPYLLHLVIAHENKFKPRKHTLKKLPKYSNRVVSRLTVDILKHYWIADQDPRTRVVRCVCYTCGRKLKPGEIVVTRKSGIGAVRHFRCAKKVNYV